MNDISSLCYLYVFQLEFSTKIKFKALLESIDNYVFTKDIVYNIKKHKLNHNNFKISKYKQSSRRFIVLKYV